MAPAVLTAQTAGTALVEHAPTLNGTVEGSIQQMTPESVVLNGDALVSGSLLVPGMPEIRVSGSGVLGTSLAGVGTPTPTDYSVSVSGNSKVSHIVNRADPVILPAVPAPAAPTGTRTVVVTRLGDPIGDFSEVRDLTATGSAGVITVPPGNYGAFVTGGTGELALGVPGTTSPSIYSFQHLTLGSGPVRILGPVIVIVGDGIVANGTVGNVSNPEWLSLRVAAGDVTINGSSTFYGYIHVPQGELSVRGSGNVVGGVSSRRLTLSTQGALRLFNVPPLAAITAPADGTVKTAPVQSLTISASASDEDGYISKIEFFANANKIGERATPPYAVTWSNIAAGRYSLTARATDNSNEVTTSAPVTFISNAPPTVSLTSPNGQLVLAAPAALTLSATAADSDGTIAKVEFFEGGRKIGSTTGPAFTTTWTGVLAGTYTVSATATDNCGATSTSNAATVVVEIPPTCSLSAPSSVTRGTAVGLVASVADSDGTVTKVVFYRNGDVVGTVNATSVSVSFSDAENLPIGTYTYVARAFDNLGLYTDSSPGSVKVSDPPDFDFKGEKPVLTIISGANQPKTSGFLPLPVRVAVYHADGVTPWPFAPVTLSVDYGTGGWADTLGGNVRSQLTVSADANGIAQAYYWMP